VEKKGLRDRVVDHPASLDGGDNFGAFRGATDHGLAGGTDGADGATTTSVKAQCDEGWFLCDNALAS
jgi:hypothetical protein